MLSPTGDPINDPLNEYRTLDFSGFEGPGYVAGLHERIEGQEMHFIVRMPDNSLRYFETWEKDRAAFATITMTGMPARHSVWATTTNRYTQNSINMLRAYSVGGASSFGTNFGSMAGIIASTDDSDMCGAASDAHDSRGDGDVPWNDPGWTIE